MSLLLVIVELVRWQVGKGIHRTFGRMRTVHSEIVANLGLLYQKNNKTDSEYNKIHTVTKIVQNKPIVTSSLSVYH